LLVKEEKIIFIKNIFDSFLSIFALVNLNKGNKMKYSEIERKLRNAGCYFYRRGGSHDIWFSPITDKKFALSHHKSEEAPVGTVKSISNDSGVKLQ